MRFVIISILASSCLANRIPPLAEPSSYPTGDVELIHAGEAAREDGFYFTDANFRQAFKAMRFREIDLQEKLAEAQMQQEQDEKALKIDAFCSKWCFPLGIIGGFLGGGALGIWAASKK